MIVPSGEKATTLTGDGIGESSAPIRLALTGSHSTTDPSSDPVTTAWPSCDQHTLRSGECTTDACAGVLPPRPKKLIAPCLAAMARAAGVKLCGWDAAGGMWVLAELEEEWEEGGGVALGVVELPESRMLWWWVEVEVGGGVEGSPVAVESRLPHIRWPTADGGTSSVEELSLQSETFHTCERGIRRTAVRCWLVVCTVNGHTKNCC